MKKKEMKIDINYSCPFHYIGSKSQLLPILLDIFEEHSNRTFYDLFAGGFSVGSNVTNQKVIYNDINTDICNLIKLIDEIGINKYLTKIKKKINEYSLSKTNLGGYLQLRMDFNNNKDPILFSLLIFYSFNHQIRYNKSGIFNTPFGKNRSSFNESTEGKLINFYEKIKSKNISFCSCSYDLIKIEANALVYVDPPYLLTTGSYNDGKRGVSSWSENDEVNLYKYLDKLNEKNIPFVLSNMLSRNDLVNKILLEWSNKYQVIDVTTKYRNYQKKKCFDKEIIVKNF
ncbi:MAG: Dam family site-specific DNA-(adenine-N6)-methyltransferase [Erysipelotrichaceae bacterium]